MTILIISLACKKQTNKIPPILVQHFFRICISILTNETTKKNSDERTLNKTREHTWFAVN